MKFQTRIIQVELKCCEDCGRGAEQPNSCCVDLEELPDTLAALSPTVVSAVVIVEVPPNIGPSPVITENDLEAFSPSEPIRGPTSPSERRALLKIWNI